MSLPKTYKGILKLLIKIAEHGNHNYEGESKLNRDDLMNIGGTISEIQNNLGEMTETLNKLGLKYDSSIH